MRGAQVALAVALLSDTGAHAAPSERWLHARVALRSDVDLQRLASLGFEVKLEEQAWASVFLPVAARDALNSTGLPWLAATEDLAADYATRLASEAPTGHLGTGAMGGYYTWLEAIDHMDALAGVYAGLVAPKASLGKTGEGRDIWAWKVSARAGLEETEPAILLLSLMHAREPEGMMALLHFADTLLAGYGVDAEASWLLEHREIWILPVLNPDGYVYNETTNPNGGGMWRKNRRDNGDGSYGVDINRNFSWEWGRDNNGSSANPASDVYRGPAALSEPETQALGTFVNGKKPSISVNTHAFGDYLIRPWGYADLLCPDDPVYQDIAEVATRGSAYKPGNVMQALGYLANGSHDDYMYGETTTKPRVYGMTPELGNGNDGFWPAPARIDPIAHEAYIQNLALTWAAGAAPALAADSHADPAPGGDGDGWPEPGETVQLVVRVRNHGLAETAGALQARLTSLGCEAQVESPTADLGTVSSQSEADNANNPFLLRIAPGAEPGKLTRLVLQLSDAGGDYPPIPLPLLVGEPVVRFAADFESGTGAWTLNGFAREAPGAGRTGTALSDSVAGNSKAGVQATAKPQAAFDLTTATRAWLEFDQRFWIDNDFDAATVEIWDGATWIAVGGETADAGSGMGVQAAGAPLYDGHRFDWRAERVDLSAFVGPGAGAFSFRFRFLTDDSIAYDGWYLDNVRLLAYGPQAPALIPNDPRPLLAVRRGSDAVFSWSPPAVDANHGAADAYLLHRSSNVRAASGFLPAIASVTLSTVDGGAVASPASYAYQLVAQNCAGSSSSPPQ